MWPHTDEDWRAMLHAGRVVGHRLDSGEVVSTAAIFEYGPGLASIGMVVVKPAWRGHGLAGALMTHLLASRAVPPPPTILIATQQGFSLYRRLGFATVAHIGRLTRTADHAPDPRQTRRGLAALCDSDMAAVRALDAEAVGASRARMLDARRSYARGASVLRGDDGSVAGFALATPQRDVLVIGPVVAPDADAAAALIEHVAAGHAGPVRVHVPTTQTVLLARLASAGFDSGTESPLMIHGDAALPGDRGRLFAVATQGFC
ncbi:MAG TPA: GNAT family N-acetyltransferase [Methylomirabilota bacterium]|nr:GNAT family N-acetyltransferase [Methylomirabilota bacterium]